MHLQITERSKICIMCESNVFYCIIDICLKMGSYSAFENCGYLS